MNNVDISKVLRHIRVTRNIFIGVFPAEKVPNKKDIISYPCCFIANTQPSWLPGEHWVAVYVGKNGISEFFDSYGRRPVNPKIKSFCGRKYIFNPVMLQSPFSAACGQFCIYFLVKRCQGIPMQMIISGFDYNNLRKNDELVMTFIDKRFPYDKLSDKSNKYLIKQICSALCKIRKSKTLL